MPDPHVKVNLGALRRFESRLAGDLRGRASGPIRDALLKWGARYRGFAQERFDKFSKGGGNWAPLSKRTLNMRRDRGRKAFYIDKTGRRRRSKRRIKRGASSLVSQRPAILRDTGSLFNALEPQVIGKPGAISKMIPFGIRVGYGGPGKHKARKSKKPKATIAEIAEFHQEGGGRLPQRKIIVNPIPSVVEDMAGDMELALRRMTKQEGISPR